MLLFQRTRVLLPAPTSSGSQPTVAPALEVPMLPASSTYAHSVHAQFKDESFLKGTDVWAYFSEILIVYFKHFEI